MMKFRAIVVEDEPLNLQRIIKLLTKYEIIEVVATAENGQEAVDVIKEYEPDLLFLDIQIPGFNSFEVLDRIDYKPYVIFTTAYDEYALKAFDNLSIDYILKPIEEERLDVAIEKLKYLSTKNEKKDTLYDELEELINNSRKKSFNRLTIKVGDEILFIPVPDVVYFKSDNKYTIVKTCNEEYLINDTLNQLEERLPDYFIRIHRSYIVNKDKIVKLKKWFGYRYSAVMNDKDNTIVPISKEFKLGDLN
ncbi:MAG: response regulator transcription factor [Candidatus Delongbacteria bacterium]|nr:response regulator transcription factor [Candidatus Delongbacteria bacterium]MBN2833925.1 response regulator transcription factor [Candidatus Delongbacteria bacterium]